MSSKASNLAERSVEFDGEKLREFRLEADMTQAEAAEKLGAKLQTYSLWERNVSKPRISFEMGNRFADAFGKEKAEALGAFPSANTFNGALLRELRLGRGLSRPALSEALKSKVSASSLEKYERNERKPSAEVMQILADYFECSTTIFSKKE